MNNKLPDGVKLKITYQGSVFECSMFIGYLLDFNDCISISSEFRDKAISDGIADIALASVAEKAAEIESIKENKIIKILLGGKAKINSKKKGDVEIALLGVRVGADEANPDRWITAESDAGKG